MKKIKCLIYCLILITYTNIYATKIVEFNYKTSDNLNVVGRLCLPDKKPIKILIKAVERNENIIDGTDSSLIEKLNYYGIGYYQYCFPDIKNPFQSVDYSIYDYSKDIKCAMDILKKNIAPQKIKIGIIGCSESANACAVYASESKDVDFFVSVTNNFIEGYKDTLYVKQNGIKERFDLYKMVFNKIIDDTTFTYNGVKYTKTDKTVNQCFNATIDSIVRKIYDYGRYDITIPQRASETISELWLGTKFNILDAKPNISNYKMIVDSIICKFIFSKPNVIALYQWHPSMCYSRIDIPTYICFGQDDKVINTEDNYNNALFIKELYQKNKFKLEIFPNLGHNLSSYIKKRKVLITDEKGKSKTIEKYSHVMDSKVIEKIVMWINRI